MERIPFLKIREVTETTDLEKADVPYQHPSGLSPTVNNLDVRTSKTQRLFKNQISSELVFNKDSTTLDLGKLIVNKSMGPNNLSVRVSFEQRHELTKQLSVSFWLSWWTAESSRDSRRAYIKAISMTGPKCDPKNYRPVSLTAKCWKMMVMFLRDEVVFSAKRFGYLLIRLKTFHFQKKLDDITLVLYRCRESDIIY